MITEEFYSLPHDDRRALFATLRENEFKLMQFRRRHIAKSENDASFKPFDDNKCIFVHVPKAAGISVAKTLFGNLAGGHVELWYYQLVFSEVEFRKYFKFTFVRNPWDRLFSAYNFLKKGGMNDADAKWAADNISCFSNFDDFVKGWLTVESIHRYVHFRPQYEFLLLPSEEIPGLNFIGFFENLNEDFEYVKSRLSRGDCVSLRNENTTFAKNNKKDFRDCYSDEAREIVFDVYQKDIELLGYEFDNSSLGRQLEIRKG